MSKEIPRLVVVPARVLVHRPTAQVQASELTKNGMILAQGNDFFVEGKTLPREATMSCVI